jgi:hypothetical protein
VSPRHFAEPTFIESSSEGRIEVARLSDGTIVQVLGRADPTRGLQRVAMRAPDGGLLVRGCMPPGCSEPPGYVYAPFWRDTTTGQMFPGDQAAVSPDGSRIATLIVEPNREQIIRQYDFSTGTTLSDLVVVPANDQYDRTLGFGWTPDSQSLVIAMTPDSSNLRGLYVVGRNAQRLPSDPTIPNTHSAALGAVFAYGSLAVLADDHVLALRYSYPIQHESWPGELDDIDLRTGTARVVLGSDSPPYVSQGCGTVPPGTVVANPARQRCFLPADELLVTARGNEALVSDDVGAWLYDGQTIRKVATVSFGTIASW